ncbi:MAG TPA: hypothetical protein VM598_02320 [Bdellovibrionota bacterium]|nr:hypothetical protein [Bdellovibrionota bacterium]
MSTVLFTANADAQQRRAPRAAVIVGAELLSVQSAEGRADAVADGFVAIDVTNRVARIVLQRELRGRPSPLNLTLQVTSITRDRCNVITYVATRRAGTVTQTLTVRDKVEEAESCRRAGQVRVDTEVELSLSEGARDAAPTVSKYSAARLSRQAPIFITDGE